MCLNCTIRYAGNLQDVGRVVFLFWLFDYKTVTPDTFVVGCLVTVVDVVCIILYGCTHMYGHALTFLTHYAIDLIML